MQRKWIGTLLAALLLLPSTLAGQTEENEEPKTQCRKRILVYLDVSGSMKEHYLKGLDGLEALFREPEFTGPTDTVTFVQFGRERGLTLSGEGPGAISELIGRLRGEVSWSNETDFRAAFDHLAEELPKGVYNRQVVLFVSDFAHETVDGMSADAAIADWTGAYSRAEAGLGDRFSSSRKTKMLLFRAQPTGRAAASRRNREDTAARVIADLETGFSAKESVGSSADLSRDLRKNLLDPPTLQVSRDPEDSSQFRFTVTNPNCYPLHVTRISVEPTAGGEAEVYEIDPDEEGELPQKAEPKTIKQPVPRGDEWRTAGVKASIETREGVTGESGGTTGNWLKFKAEGAVFERRWGLRDVLRLDLELTGYTDTATAKPYVLTFGDDAEPLARGEFEPPAFSGAEPQRFRVVLPLRKDGERAEGVRVAVKNAETLSAGGDRSGLVEDTLASHANRVLIVTALLSLILLAIVFFWVRNAVDSYPVFRRRRWRYLIWIPLLFMAFVPLVAYLCRIWLLRLQDDPATLDQILRWAVAGIIFFLASLLIILVVRAKFVRSTASGSPLPLAKYIFESRAFNVAAWVLGGLLALGVQLWWQAVHVEAQEMRRNIEAPALKVTSD